MRHLIKTNNLEENISFTGRLDAEEMKQEYLNANVFICPSSIENSPNSLGEAQLLGVPVIASYVGGIPDMMRGDESHLYRFEEIEMLSEIIKQLFASKDGINTETMRQIARQRHNPSNNVQQLMNIYLGILN